MTAQKTLDKIVSHVKTTSFLQSSMALLEWDQQTYMPSDAAGYRAEQLTYLAGELHRRQTDPQLGEWLNELSEPDAGLDETMAANTRELKKDFDKKNRVPANLVQAMTKACSLAQQTWIASRKADDFMSFAKPLKEIFDLKREYAEAVGYENELYDALLDDYEPGAKTSDVRQVLMELRAELVPLIQAVASSGFQPDSNLVRRDFPVAQQEAFGRMAAQRIGFDFQRGRLDVTAHPFCETMGPSDIRLTTRYDQNFFNSAFFGILHEAGHGIYEQGLPDEQFGFPAGSYCSLGIHESQSRLWENLVGRSFAFWEFLFPEAQKIFPDSLGDVGLDEFFAAINIVQPSPIRVEADEATYNLHIIIRFELEQEIFNKEIEVEHVADAWNAKYEKYLGIQPPSHAKGVLQDIHWSAGLMGYFPTYSLGNLYASQFFAAAESQLGNLDQMFRQGEFLPLKTWLNENVHRPGRTLSAPKLGMSVVGKPLGHTELIRQLKNKLTHIYNI